MSFALKRRRISCFYCGKASQHQSEGRPQHFECTSCQAVNYLDKVNRAHASSEILLTLCQHGQITDPPVTSTTSTTSSFRFAHAPARPLSPPPPTDENSIFCQTCLKNQHLVKENLAAYLPPEDDPQFEQYVNSYETYRQGLEERYPQLCQSCLPKVEQRLDKTVHTTRADNLRRLLDKSRQQSTSAHSGNLLYVVLFKLAGIGWTFSAVAQVCWHVMVAMSIPQAWSLDEYEEALFVGTPSAEQCAQQAIQERKLHKACVTPITSWMPYVLAIGFITIWWSNKLSMSYGRSGLTMRGVKDFYMLQGTALIIRFLAYNYLHPEAPQASGDVLKGAHIFTVLFIALVSNGDLYLILSTDISKTSIISLNTIKSDLNPKVNFSMDKSSLRANVGPARAESANLSPSHPLSRPTVQRPFPISKLGASTSSLKSRAQSPLFPPSVSQSNDQSDDDAMDWTPSATSSFTPITFRPGARSLNLPIQTSPFHGTLPAAPRAPSHKLRQPPALQAGALRQVSGQEKAAFLAGFGSLSSTKPSKRPTTAQYQTDDDETTATEEDEAQPRKTGKKRREMEMANPKFWPQSDMNKNTGLENMFEETFTMTDGPQRVMQSGRRMEKADERTNQVWGSFVDGKDGLDTQGVRRDGRRWTSVMTIGILPVACLTAAVLVVKGGLL
jgi:hypothetical protein